MGNAECESSWQTVEGYHRVCDHDELSEEFDSIFDTLAFDETACANVHCNKVEEEDHVTVCTDDLNSEWNDYLVTYGALDVDTHILSASSRLVAVFAAVLSLGTVLFV